MPLIGDWWPTGKLQSKLDSNLTGGAGQMSALPQGHQSAIPQGISRAFSREDRCFAIDDRSSVSVRAAGPGWARDRIRLIIRSVF
jgi:hypothetical protein